MGRRLRELTPSWDSARPLVLQVAQNRSYLYTVDLNVSIIYIVGVLGVYSCYFERRPCPMKMQAHSTTNAEESSLGMVLDVHAISEDRLRATSLGNVLRAFLLVRSQGLEQDNATFNKHSTNIGDIGWVLVSQRL